MQTWLGAETPYTQSYENHFVELDPVMQAVRATAPGTVIAEGAISGSTLERSEFYHQWVRPQGLYRATMTKFLHEGDAVGVLVCASGLKAERKSGSNGPQLLYRLAPHLQRAMRMHLRLGRLGVERDVVTGALDLLRPAVAVVDASARVKFANRAAEVLLARADGVSYSAHGLSAVTVTQTNRLRALVAQAAATAPRIAAGGAMLIERPSLRRPYQVLVSPLSVQTPWAAIVSYEPAALVLIIDPDMEPANVEQRLRSLYGLTSAEAHVATAIGSGESLYTVAGSLGVLPSTARTHLHHVFLKTGTQRQAQLVQLLTQTALVAQG
ncbi:helix-turn-helix transcriptional regulator [Paraburkholderia sediminicola]|nr:helix-turn-helix transcriptional regulator [Paraburkholderia sediminicola]